MRIAILIPSYTAPEPQTRDAVQRMMDYSRCKCAWDNLAQAQQMFEQRKRNGHNLAANPFHHPADCPRGKHDVTVEPSYSAAIVHWARNASIVEARKDFDYILFVDADMVPPPDALDSLIGHQKDIISGLCTKRIDPPEPTMKMWVEEAQAYGTLLKWEAGTLLEVDAVGAAFLLIRRKVIEDLGEAYHPKEYRETGNAWAFEFLKTPNGGEIGEDIAFCWKAQRIGYKIWVDTSVKIGHLGKYTFGIDDFMAYQDARIAGEVGPTEGRKAHELVSQ